MEGGPARLGAPFERIGGLSADRGHYSRCLPLRMLSSEGTKSPEGFQLHIVERLRQGGFHLLLLRVHQLGQSLFEPFPALQLIELAERKVGDQPSGDTRDDPPHHTADKAAEEDAACPEYLTADSRRQVFGYPVFESRRIDRQ